MKRQRVSSARTSPPYKESLISCELIGSDEDGYLTFVDGLPVVTPSGGGGSGTPAVSVENETTFGLSSSVGVSTNYARQDHTHGTPNLPTASDIGAEEEGVAASLIATHTGLSDPHTQYQKESEKSSAGGYASLDSSTKVPIAELPTGTTGTTVALGNAVATHEALSDPHTQYQKESEKSSANGYASLDISTKVPIAELPTGTSSTTVALGDHMQTVALGGTNKSSWNANSVVIATSSSVLSDTGSGVAGQTLISGGPSSPPTWSTQFNPIKSLLTTGSGTIDEPVGASRIFLRARGGGGSGGGGRRGAAGSSRGGGGGGSSSSYAEISFDKSTVSWPLSYTIGAGGTGGAGATTDNTNGSPGNDGTETVVTDASGIVILRALKGRAGGAGSAATATGGAAVSTAPHWMGLGGGNGSTTGGSAGSEFTLASGGGGAGAGITSGNSSNPGRAAGIGGYLLDVGGTSNAGAGGVANGGNGGDAVLTKAYRGSGGGGGGGGGDAGATVPGGRGGHGQDGSGGGGGGGSTNGQNGGNGGNGGDGFLEYCAV